MYDIKDIKQLHLEISSLCNARCPQCPRNFRGFPFNDGYPECNLTLEQVHKIFKPTFIKQLVWFHINGNYGDMVMNPETTDIIRYFKTHNPKLLITICTNGSARQPDFWRELAELDCEIEFALDGLEDTHDMYRQNTNWHTVIRNAKTFMSAGGRAIWKFIKFKHNIHQLEHCRNMADVMGFIKFMPVDDGRNQGAVYDRQGKLRHILGDANVEHTHVNSAIQERKDTVLTLEDIHEMPRSMISCHAKNSNELFVTATGEVYPCCWLGMYPKMQTGFGTDMAVINQQIAPLVKNNNALEYDLEECIAWFNLVAQSWSCSTYESGRLIQCDRVCGK